MNFAQFSFFFSVFHRIPISKWWYETCHKNPCRSDPIDPERSPMQPKQSPNRFRCLNCGSIVHWTDFCCEVCGRNPREKESAGEVYMPQPNIISESSERRKHPRYDFQGKVVLNRVSRGKFVDLSQGGAKLKTALRLFRDELVHLDFAINGIPIHTKARVVHIRKAALEDIFTMGVCFEAIARDHSEILNNHLAAISEETPRVQCSA